MGGVHEVDGEARRGVREKICVDCERGFDRAVQQELGLDVEGVCADVVGAAALREQCCENT